MAELKIIGAQRIKALTEVLMQQKAKSVEDLKHTLPSRDQVRDVADEIYGLSELRKQVEDLQLKAKDLEARIVAVTGDPNYSWNRKKTAYEKTFEDLLAARYTEPIAALEREFDDKARSLWLCETLEDAKKIVYPEQEAK